MKWKDIVRFFIAILLIALILLFLYYKGSFSIIEKIKVYDFLVLTSFTLLSYFVAGFQVYYLVKKQNNISIKLSDILLLPLSMSLFSYVIPTNGGLLYSVFFLKKKYNIDSSKGFSIGVFSIYISFILSGLTGIVVCFIYNKIFSILFLLSILFIFMPLLVFLLNKLIQKLTFRKNSFSNKTQVYLNKIVISSNDLIKDNITTIVNIIINFFLLAIMLLSYFWLVKILKIEISTTSLILVILLMRISSLIRILPGNLGVEELFTAGIFSLIGKDPETGMMFSLFLRLSVFTLIIPLGVFHTVFNSKHFNFSDIKSLFKVFGKQNRK